MEVDEGKHDRLTSLLSKCKSMPKSVQMALTQEIEFLKVQQSQQGKKSIGKTKEKLYQKLNYRTENYIENHSKSKERFDTIMCMSTVKWVHLCFGDVGVKTLFVKAYE